MIYAFTKEPKYIIYFVVARSLTPSLIGCNVLCFHEVWPPPPPTYGGWGSGCVTDLVHSLVSVPTFVPSTAKGVYMQLYVHRSSGPGSFTSIWSCLWLPLNPVYNTALSAEFGIHPFPENMFSSRLCHYRLGKRVFSCRPTYITINVSVFFQCKKQLNLNHIRANVSQSEYTV